MVTIDVFKLANSTMRLNVVTSFVFHGFSFPFVHSLTFNFLRRLLLLEYQQCVICRLLKIEASSII